MLVNQKKIFACVAFCITFTTSLFAQPSVIILQNDGLENTSSSVPFFSEEKSKPQYFLPVDYQAYDGTIKQESVHDFSFACYKFNNTIFFDTEDTKEKMLAIDLELNDFFPASISVALFYDDENPRLSFLKEDNISISDFNSIKKLKLQFPIKKEENKNPKGLIIWTKWNPDITQNTEHSGVIKIKSFSLQEKKIGFEFNENNNSLFVSFDSFGKDFSDIQKQIDSTFSNTKNNFFFDIGVAKKLTEENQTKQLPSIYFSGSDLNISFYPYTENFSSKISSSFIKKNISSITINDSEKSFYKILITPQKKDQADLQKDNRIIPISVDPGFIAEYPKSLWRNKNYELFSWDRFSEVLIFDTASYEFQSKMFDRIACFVEKIDSVGTILSEEEMLNRHGFLAHDYNAESLASFFSVAFTQNIELREEEELLKEILLTQKIIKCDEYGLFFPGKGAVLSISQNSELYRRKLFINHECSHALFFCDKEFKDFCTAVYNESSDSLKYFFRAYFSTLENLKYNTDSLELMQNEFMAYLVQLSPERMIKHFTGYIAEFLENSHDYADVAEYIKTDGKNDALLASKKLSDYLYNRWGIQAGRINLLSAEYKKQNQSN